MLYEGRVALWLFFFAAGLKDARGSSCWELPPSLHNLLNRKDIDCATCGNHFHVFYCCSRTRCEASHLFKCRFWVLPVGETWRCRNVAREELLRSVEENVIAHLQRMLTNCVDMTMTITVSCKLYNSSNYGDKPPLTLYRFAASEAHSSSDTFRQNLSSRYMIPDHFWTDACKRSNGFFGCQDIYNEERKLDIHSINIAIVQSTQALAYRRP